MFFATHKKEIKPTSQIGVTLVIIMIERGIESQAKLYKEKSQQTDMKTVLQYLTQPQEYFAL